jgi:hypothetical protein
MRWLEGRRSRDMSPDAVAGFLTECSQQASDLIDHAEELTNLELARAEYILMRAGDLRRRLRHSRREFASMPVRLSCEGVGRVWDEETETQLLSRHGAQVVCEHPVEVGERLLVTRLDTGRQAHARVASCQRKEDGRLEIGIELLNCDNFWEFE